MRIVKGIRFLKYLGPRLFRYSVMEKLRGRSFRFYNEERILDDNSDIGYKAIDSKGNEVAVSKKNYIHDLKPISTEDCQVSIIIPSDNLDNITLCVEKITENTTYPNYEIIVVTNSEIAEHLSRFGIPNSEFRICTFDKPYNFSDKCNEGAAAADGDVLCFYNDDVCPLDKNWLHQMLEALSLPNVGGITPLQMINNNTVLHAGFVLDVPGLQTFSFPGIVYTPPRHLKSNQFIVRDVSALSGACLLIRRTVFEEVGMFNTIDTPNGFSDTEISFKLRDGGYRCVIVPSARMIHDNKITWRKTDKPDKSFLYMIEKWGMYFTQDVFFTEKMKVLYGISPPSHIYKYHAPVNIVPRKPGGRDILFVNHELSLTGAPIALMDMVKVVIENGDWPVVVSLLDGPLRQEYLDMGVTVIIDNSMCDLAEASAFAFDYVARNFDLVVVNTLACWRVIGIMNDSLPPIIWWIHESPIALNNLKHSLPNRLPAKAKAYVPSEYCAKMLKNTGLSYSLDLLAFGITDYASSEKPKADRKETTFLLIGPIEHRKAQDVFVEALKHIDSNIIAKAQFVLIGKAKDPEIHKICLLAKEKYGNIDIYDNMPREEVLEWLSKADCLLIPSREDPLPVVGIEAMMYSIPLICSDTTGQAEYIIHAENGLIFPNEDSRALAEHIRFVIENKNKMTDMGRRGRKEIYEKHFTIDIFNKNALRAINEIMEAYS